MSKSPCWSSSKGIFFCLAGRAQRPPLFFVLPDGPGLRSRTAAGAMHLHHREILFADATSNFPSFGIKTLFKVISDLKKFGEWYVYYPSDPQDDGGAGALHLPPSKCGTWSYGVRNFPLLVVLCCINLSHPGGGSTASGTSSGGARAAGGFAWPDGLFVLPDGPGLRTLREIRICGSKENFPSFVYRQMIKVSSR